MSIEKTLFKPGQIVVLKADRSLRGAVVNILPSIPEDRVQVFMDNAIQTFYASQLQADIAETKMQIVSKEQFYAHLTALQIKFPGLATLYSLNTARINFIPYQFRPVLRFIRSDRPRLLIADSVGVGKTIEAGLILRELQARQEVNSILIICPRPLVTEKKWYSEMRRFEENFEHLDGDTLRHCLEETDRDGVWPDRWKKAILPYSLLDKTLLGDTSKGKKRKKNLLDLNPPPHFDLVIVDEAHHIRNPQTANYKAVRFFCDNADAVLFLTATPIQLGNNDLFVLLNALRPDLIIDEDSFCHITAPNPFINQAVSAMRSQSEAWQKIALENLEMAGKTEWGQNILQKNPVFVNICTQLTAKSISCEDRVKMITETESLHSLAGVINRTLRRDIGEITTRKPETIAVPMTPEQRKIYEEILRLQTAIFQRLHSANNVLFMLSTLQRQTASCLFGLVPFLDDILSRHLDELFWEEASVTDFTMSINMDIELIFQDIENILQQAKMLDASDDPKYKALLTVIHEKEKRENNKIMLFSCFRHTLDYLYKRLLSEGLRVGLVHGKTPDRERAALRERFAKERCDSDCLDILLFSEIGCEGLDYQFCDCIVNYDLPWNPMRIEQRIGRIDRTGQLSKSVAIVNLITSDTVDAEIYHRCLERIGIFEHALGENEEILGEITQEIHNIAENFSLSEADRIKRLTQLADNKIRLLQEQDALERQQVEMFGMRLPPEQLEQDIEEARNIWLAPDFLQNMTLHYLQQRCGSEKKFFLGDKALKNLRLAREDREKLLHDFQQLPRQRTPIFRQWEQWLKGAEPNLSVTFDAVYAMNQPQSVLLMPLHPLLRQAALFFEDQSILVYLKVSSDLVPTGKYPFIVYRWQFLGIQDDLAIKLITLDPVLELHLDKLLKQAHNAEKEGTIIQDAIWDQLDARHYSIWHKARQEHSNRVKSIVNYRWESLESSRQARFLVLDRNIQNATDEKIRRMREAEKSNASADYERRFAKLTQATERADILAERVAYGVLDIQ